MEKLDEILHELGISKVKLAKFLGVSRQMVYNYLELNDVNKWPKDKKVLLFNLLGIKTAEEINDIKVDTDYILTVEAKLSSLLQITEKKDFNSEVSVNDLNRKSAELLKNLFELLKEKLEDEKDVEGYNIIKYLYHYMQSIDNAKELKYTLAYVSKIKGFTKPNEFVFDETDQFTFESILFSAMVLYNDGDVSKTNLSKTRLVESHKRFVTQIEHKIEEILGRTKELETMKLQALKELGYTVVTEENGAEVFGKMAEIESRKTAI